jgi:predicted HicB family RNase H-like nuclease
MTPETPTQPTFEARCHRVLQFARDLYRQSPDWVRFFREVVGVDGAARKVFTTNAEFIAFERSDAFHTIKRMVNALRNNKATSHSEEEGTRVITVRLPESVHEALKAEADDHGTSMNKLCVSKLLQVLEEDEALQRARQAARGNSRVDSVASSGSGSPVSGGGSTGSVGSGLRPGVVGGTGVTASSFTPAGLSSAGYATSAGGGYPNGGSTSSTNATPPYRPSL